MEAIKEIEAPPDAEQAARAWWAACRIEPKLLPLQAAVATLVRGDLWSVLGWSDRLAELRDANPRLAPHWRSCHSYLLAVHGAAINRAERRKAVAQ